MIKPPPPRITGIAGLMLLFCTVGAVAGLFFDIVSNNGQRVGVIAQPGAHAFMGVGVAAAALIAAHALRFVLGRRIGDEATRGGRDASHRS